ncbi:glutamate receptor ionotropic, kainate 2 [Hyalella azteca]|uniref:Glutamate receptor ionotropic, kainate 2 n=1 Tax=Hyalella azteca TaxID=294128 RepID=A0A8B7PQK1_HYAAZ|nr:glutamate receptor ionotropic, kainate 2 [Hyalella azteca]
MQLQNRAADDSSVLTIGGLFDRSKMEEAAFRAAISAVNGGRPAASGGNLSARVEILPPGDSFIAARKACSILEGGVAAIFGPSSDVSAAHVQAICDAMEVPHIETRWQYRLTRDPYSVNLYPHPATLSRAYVDVLRAQGWTKFTLIYETMDGLVRVQDVLKDPHFRITLRQLPHTLDFRPLLKDIKKSGSTHLLLDVRLSKLQSVMKQSQQIGLMTSYHHYFITTLDLHTVDLEDFKYGGTNITSLRLIDPAHPPLRELVHSWMPQQPTSLQTTEKPPPGLLAGFPDHLPSDLYNTRAGLEEPPGTSTPPDPSTSTELPQVTSSKEPDLDLTLLSTEVALIYDAVQLFAKALENLDRSSHVNVTRLRCDEDVTWGHGNSLVNYMKWVQLDGFSGHIKFDADGFRRDVSLDVLELTVTGLEAVGRWDWANGVNFSLSGGGGSRTSAQTLHNKTLRIVTVMASPYTMFRESAETLVGNHRYEGFCVDLITEIAAMLGFNFTIEIAPDGQHGKYNAEQQRWTGLVGELLEQRADLAIGDLTITYDREQAVDFTTPWMNLGISILYWKASKKPPKLFSFLSPLSIDVWLYIVTSYLAVSVLLFFLGRLTPYEFVDRSPENNQFSLSNSLWFTLGSLLQQSTEQMPKAASTRLIAGLWWFFTLIMISSYTANLAAFLTVERMVSPIESAEDLAAQTKIKYGSLYGGSTWNFFFDSSSVGTYQRMFSFMESQRPSVYASSNEEGVERVVKSAGKYAFLMESSSIEYITERHCQLTQVGGLLDSKSYGIALPPGSPYRALVNAAVLRLQELGRLHDLKQRWWKERKEGGKCKVDESKAGNKANELGLSSVGGVFAVLVGGMMIAFCVAIGEFIWKSRKVAIAKHASIWSEMCHDFRLVAACDGSSSSNLSNKKSDVLSLTDHVRSPSPVTVTGRPLENSGSHGHVPSCGASCSLASTYLGDSRGQINPNDRSPHYTKKTRSPDRFNVSDLPSPVLHDRRMPSPIRDFRQAPPSFSCSGSVHSDFGSKTLDRKDHYGSRNLQQNSDHYGSRSLDRDDHLDERPMNRHLPQQNLGSVDLDCADRFAPRSLERTEFLEPRPLDRCEPYGSRNLDCLDHVDSRARNEHSASRPLQRSELCGSKNSVRNDIMGSRSHDRKEQAESRASDRAESHMRGAHGALGPPLVHSLGRVARSPSEGEISSESSSLQAPDLPFQLIPRAKCS